MDHERSPFLNWGYYNHGKTMEELKNSLLCTTMELETTRLAAQEELRKREDQLTHLRDLLNKAIKERDEAQNKFQTLLLEKLIFQQQKQQQTAPHSTVSSVEDEPKREIDSNNGFSSSDCEESIVSSPVVDPIFPPFSQESTAKLLPEKPLPEKGKLLQAVMKAGPLLQTLLLAGPLPQWRHPPPPLDSFEIPPVAIPSPPAPPPLLPLPPLLNEDTIIDFSNCGRSNNKRGLCEGSDSSSRDTKYQRVAMY